MPMAASHFPAGRIMLELYYPCAHSYGDCNAVQAFLNVSGVQTLVLGFGVSFVCVSDETFRRTLRGIIVMLIFDANSCIQPLELPPASYAKTERRLATVLTFKHCQFRTQVLSVG